MTDPLVITSVIGAVGALIVSVITHLKYSECCGAKMMLRRSQPDTPTTNAPMSGIFIQPVPTEKTPINNTIEIHSSV